MRTVLRSLLAAVLVVLASPPLSAQTTVNTTTLSAALGAPAQGVPATLVQVASATNIAAPTATFPGSELFVDQEAMLVTAVSGTTLTVIRGWDRTKTTSHANSAIVYLGPNSGANIGSPFVFTDPPIGTCTLSSEVYGLRINVATGEIWQCTNSQWMNVIDSVQFVGPGNCYYSTSGGTFTAQTNVGVAGNTGLGLINSGGTPPGTPVMQVATTNAGTATNTISCLVPLPTRANAGKGVYVVDATWIYGVQQTALGTQAVVLASGTMNGVLAFGQITLPAAATSETPSTVAQARWDTGTMVLTPTAANFNTATTTAGAFATEKIAPANPVAMATDLTAYYVNFTVLCTATSATTVNVAGVLIHYRTVTGL